LKPPRFRFPKRGEVYLVSFDPTLGAEIQKTRPALILQNNTGNSQSRITIVAAITSNVSRTRLTDVLVKAPEGGLTMDSLVLLNQIRSIDKIRLIKRLGALKRDSLLKVDTALMFSLGILT
jgi:mRNA interferase MazF